MTTPTDRKYTKDHEWVKLVGAKAQVGITNYAQGELGDVVFVDPPKTGRKVKRGDVLCVVESTKAASDVYAPVSGTIVESNSALSAHPEKINTSPYEAGWLAVIDEVDAQEVSDLFSAEQYESYLKMK